MRIAFLADPKTSNGWYRGFGPMSMLGKRGHVVVPLPVDRKQLPPGALRGVDVLHIHRYSDDWVERLAREAQAQGAVVVWDDDDAYGSLVKGTAAYRRFGGFQWEKRLAWIRRIFRHVDLVTTPSAALAETLRQHGAKRTAVIENYVPNFFLKHERPEKTGFTIGWVAALEHQVDLERIPIVETLQRLLDERPEVRVCTIGLRLGLEGPRYFSTRRVPHIETLETFGTRAAPQYAPRGFVQANRERTDVAIKRPKPGGLANYTAKFDVGIAPLADLEFNRGRSNVKLKEYAAGGTPWLASPVGPYLGMGEQQGGRLVADDRWYEELLALVSKPRLQRKLSKRARSWVEQETLEKNVHRWERVLEDALAERRAA